ncbi:HAMP domain-containing protein [Verrucomicrobiota bacterium]
MTIYHKMILGSLVSATLVAAVGLIAIHETQNVLLDRIGEASASLTAETLDKIDRSIHNRIEIFQDYSRDPMLRQFLQEAGRQLEERTDREAYIQQQDRDWQSAPKDTITSFMRSLIDCDLSVALRQKAQFYEEKYGYRVFGELFVTDKHGVNVAQTGKTTDYYQADEAWWQAAKLNGLHVGNAKYDESAGVRSLDVGIRIDGKNGDFLGVIKVILSIDDVFRVISGLERTDGDKAAVTVEYKLIDGERKLLYATEDHRPGEEGIGSELLRRFNRGDFHKLYLVAEGDKPGEGDELFVFARSTGYGDYGGLGWVLIAEYDTDEIFAPILRLRNAIGVATAIAGTLAILLGFFISVTISKQLDRLGAASAEIAEGNLDARVDIRSKDELGKLAGAFNGMAEKLSVAMRKQTALAQTEKEQADELRAANQQLRASEQQLRANEQQLRASEQQLRAANQLLKAKEQTLLASQKDLAGKLFELERFNKLMVGREIEMVKLKQEVNALLEAAGQPRKYAD